MIMNGPMRMNNGNCAVYTDTFYLVNLFSGYC